MSEKKISPEELTVEKLSRNHDLASFHCGDDDLDEFILQDALPQRKDRLNQTYICRYHGEIIAFFTVSADSIKINKNDKKRIGVNYPAFPSIKIGRLAVHEDHKRKNVGSILIMYAVGLALELGEKVGVRFISVDAYQGIEKFYEKNYFVELAECEDRHVAMYTDLEDWTS
ncbi:GNAT family N-acetyltransferase [Methanobacterium petrolearium]|nr:GNAT family N-acetyltransferase [Methanobacterium petrolearium]MBP1945711.1 GNAT superfamily N-acetyltransferase [Methanobacterium petrolearium]